MWRITIIIFLLFIPIIRLTGQVDSLRQVFDETKEDTVKMKSAMHLARHYVYQNNDSSLYFNRKFDSLAKKVGDTIDQIYALYTYGEVYFFETEYQKSLDYSNKAFDLSVAYNDTIYYGNILYYLSRSYSRIARYDLTIDAQLKAIRFFEERKRPEAVAVMYNNMSIAYSYLGDYEASNMALKQALKIYRETDQIGKAYMNFSNLTRNYVELEKPDTAEIYYDSIRYIIDTYHKDEPELINYYKYWLGEIYTVKAEQVNDDVVSEQYYEKALKAFKESHDHRKKNEKEIDEMTYTLLGIGKTLIKLKSYDDAIPYLKEALKNAEISNATKRIMMSHAALARAYRSIGKNDLSAFHFEKEIDLRREMFNKEKTMATMSARMEFEVEKKEQEIELLNMESEVASKEAKLKDAELKQTRSQQYLLIVILSVAVLFIAGLFVVNKRRKKANRIIAAQKQEVEHKNKEILDSITYAKRLQDAILPSQKLVKSFLLDSFIFYKPKDIVAGDFYFMDVVESSKTKRIYYAAADCTGHGVPGAMVSIVGANGLKRCIQEFELRDPGEILDKLNEIVEENFVQSEERIRDGMDIALCCLEYEDDQIKRLIFSGAHNPVWIINKERENWPDEAVKFKEGNGVEIKATKQAIGYTERTEKFVSQSFELESGDTLYTFSDGYADQFGGTKGKKMKTANFRRLLFDIQDLNISQQHQRINEYFEEWKNDYEQVDDVCVIGVRV
tara:strand:- start:62396 stop:64585 length:2190 start_codon:yes stop_codon:yes gene_type:complete